MVIRRRRQDGGMSSPERQPSTRGADFRSAMERAWQLLGRLNALTPGDFDAMRALLGELTGSQLDASVRVLPPFHTDTGRNLRFGRNVFVNHGCTAMDLGGIDIGDDVMIGPNVQLISSGHPLDPATRRRSITPLPSSSVAARGSPPAPRCSKASRSARTPSWPRVQSSQRTCPRARWSPAFPHVSSARSEDAGRRVGALRRDGSDGAGSPWFVLVREPDQLGVKRTHPQLAFGVRLVELGEPDRDVAAADAPPPAILPPAHPTPPGW